MTNPAMYPWPEPDHEKQMLLTKCVELEAINKTQAEQIKRLQAAIQEILPEYNRLDVEEQLMEEPHEEPQTTTYKDLGLKPEDME